MEQRITDIGPHATIMGPDSAESHEELAPQQRDRARAALALRNDAGLTGTVTSSQVASACSRASEATRAVSLLRGASEQAWNQESRNQKIIARLAQDWVFKCL